MSLQNSHLHSFVTMCLSIAEVLAVLFFAIFSYSFFSVFGNTFISLSSATCPLFLTLMSLLPQKALTFLLLCRSWRRHHFFLPPPIGQLKAICLFLSHSQAALHISLQILMFTNLLKGSLLVLFHPGKGEAFNISYTHQQVIKPDRWRPPKINDSLASASHVGVLMYAFFGLFQQGSLSLSLLLRPLPFSSIKRPTDVIILEARCLQTGSLLHATIQ